MFTRINWSHRGFYQQFTVVIRHSGWHCSLFTSVTLWHSILRSFRVISCFCSCMLQFCCVFQCCFSDSSYSRIWQDHRRLQALSQREDWKMQSQRRLVVMYLLSLLSQKGKKKPIGGQSQETAKALSTKKRDEEIGESKVCDSWYNIAHSLDHDRILHSLLTILREFHVVFHSISGWQHEGTSRWFYLFGFITVADERYTPSWEEKGTIWYRRLICSFQTIVFTGTNESSEAAGVDLSIEVITETAITSGAAKVRFICLDSLYLLFLQARRGRPPRNSRTSGYKTNEVCSKNCVDYIHCVGWFFCDCYEYTECFLCANYLCRWWLRLDSWWLSCHGMLTAQYSDCVILVAVSYCQTHLRFFKASLLSSWRRCAGRLRLWSHEHTFLVQRVLQWWRSWFGVPAGLQPNQGKLVLFFSTYSWYTTTFT